MSSLIFFKLLGIFLVVTIGWVVGKLKWLGHATEHSDPARTLANAAYYIFVPALLFRTTARIDFAAIPWGTLVAAFVPMIGLLVIVYFWQRSRGGLPIAGPSVRAITAVFGNTVQVGIPMAAALFGEAGLAIHLAIVSMHALTLLTLTTALVELDLARAERDGSEGGQGGRHLAATLLATARNTLIHPVVMPVLIGMAWNVAGLPLPAVADEVLVTLGQAVVPLCLVLIGMSLAYYGVRGAAFAAVWLSAVKLLAQPALVLAIAHWGFGLTGLPLAVIVMMAALPIGSNALIFAQRYRTLQAETTAATVLSTLAFVATAPLWLSVLAILA